MKEPRRLLDVTNSGLERELLESGIVEHPSPVSLERTLARVANGSRRGRRNLALRETASRARYERPIAERRRLHQSLAVAMDREGEQGLRRRRVKQWACWVFLAALSFVSGTAASWAWG